MKQKILDEINSLKVYLALTEVTYQTKHEDLYFLKYKKLILNCDHKFADGTTAFEDCDLPFYEHDFAKCSICYVLYDKNYISDL